MKNKKQLYESIINSVAKEVKKALNEYSKFENADHRRNKPDLLNLKNAINNLNPEYKAQIYSQDYMDHFGIHYNLSMKRDGIRVGVLVQTRKKTNKTHYVQLVNKKRYETTSKLEYDDIDEICIVCPPEQNFDGHGSVIDNTKACFFDKQYITDIINNIDNNNSGPQVKNTAEGETIMFPEQWAKTHAKQVITYKYKL